MPGSLSESELQSLGLDSHAAVPFAHRLAELWSEPDAVRRWMAMAQQLLSPQVPFSIHSELFARNYAGATAPYPPPAWAPEPRDIERANLTDVITSLDLAGVEEFARWARADAGRFWGLLIERLGIRLAHEPSAIVDLSRGTRQPRWLPGARLNIAESCLRHPQAGIVATDETGREQRADVPEIARLAQRFAGALAARRILAGDAVALVLPLTLEAVVAFLGTILAGAAAVCIAESFAPAEIARRAAIAQAKLVVTQDSLLRAGKRLPLYDKLCDVSLPPIVVTCGGGGSDIKLRGDDIFWDEFLSTGEAIAPVLCDPDDVTTVLFSSGTTADPKVIPWTHTTPIKCAADGYLYHDLHADDVLAWPTGMGWMMGPWLIYAGLINGSRLALFDGHPATPAFVTFVERAGVTVLGVIPSLVAAWQKTKLWDDADWTRIRLYSSTGECSQPMPMLALSSRAGYRPVIEYCGGTEIGGGYITSTLLRPWSPSCFNQPAFGLTLSLYDDEGPSATRGEVFLGGAAMGLSTRLLHGDHQETYFAGAPRDPSGEPMRRHGDSLEAIGDGFYRVLGRADDAMNLGGIKVAAVEIERVLNRHAAVLETAAVALSDAAGGPSRLVVFAVPRHGPVDTAVLRQELQRLVGDHLNPLFRISEVRWIDALPRTASNKVMRRLLRTQHASS
ncbi:MAG: AMP-dependent synthetase [Planctomycetaceae bacterium]|nr:AMP-dependent synthetase [Planctomycetaceae bacterium]